MANPNRGEVAFDVEGKTYKLAFTANSLCDLEDALDLGIDEIAQKLGGGRVRVKYARAAMWAGLQQNHPDITIKQAGDLLGELTVAKAMELVTKSLQLSFPESAPDDPTRPPQPGSPKTDGTGLAS